MSDKFIIEIISPATSILKHEAKEVTIPSYEGQMGILRDHIPFITFLRPGIISIEGQKIKNYYVEEGTVEFSNNNLSILTSTAEELINLEKSSIEELLRNAEKSFRDDDSSDKEKYLLSHKIDVLKEISQ